MSAFIRKVSQVWQKKRQSRKTNKGNEKINSVRRHDFFTQFRNHGRIVMAVSKKETFRQRCIRIFPFPWTGFIGYMFKRL